MLWHEADWSVRWHRALDGGFRRVEALDSAILHRSAQRDEAQRPARSHVPLETDGRYPREFAYYSGSSDDEVACHFLTAKLRRSPLTVSGSAYRNAHPISRIVVFRNAPR
jgi:hypothetical protein